MRKTMSFSAAVLLATALLLAPAAQAGRSCEARPRTTTAVTQGLALAERTQTALDASGANVVLLARAGQDLGKYGLRYSHLGFAYQQADASAPGGHVWRILHKLNQCGSADSAIYRQGLGDFFLDDPWRFEAAWVVPAPEVQQRLAALLQDTPRAVALNHPPYSLVSYAWGQTYQQSNQWAIETLALAMEPGVAGADVAAARQKAQAWLQLKGYQPTTLRIGPLTRLGGRLTAANVAFDDHPNAKRFSDRIETVTVDSVFAWMQHSGLATPPVSVQLPKGF